MADRYLLESGAPDGYSLEDGSGVLILEGSSDIAASLDAGAITIAGQTVTATINAPIGGGVVTIAGQTVAAGFGHSLTAGAITVAGQTVTSAIGTNVSLDAGAITISGESVMFAIVAGQTAQGGGWGWFNLVDAERQRRKRRREEEIEAEAEAEAIPDKTTREIALLLRAQEAKDAERAEIARIRSLAQSYDGQDERLSKAVARAAAAKSYADALALLRAVERAEEEDFMAAVIMAVIDD